MQVRPLLANGPALVEVTKTELQNWTDLQVARIDVTDASGGLTRFWVNLEIKGGRVAATVRTNTLTKTLAKSVKGIWRTPIISGEVKPE